MKRPATHHLRLVTACTLFALSAACGQEIAQQHAPSPIALGPGVDIAGVISQVHHAYRPEGEAFMAEHSTFSARVTAGRVALTPRHWPRDGSSRPFVEGAPLVLETIEIGRASALHAVGLEATPAYEDGSLRLERGSATEWLRNQNAGVEQSWRFERAPAGSGDLVVRVRADRLRYTGESAAGLHFADPATGLGFCYGHATWIDAGGARRPVVARWRDQAIELRVPAAALTGGAFPALLDPLISPELGMDAPVLAPAGAEQNAPALASNGDGFLVVWQDNRRGYYYDVFAARVTTDGQLLDDYGIAIAVEDRSQTAPAVASDGSNYLVVWQHSGTSGTDILGVRVSSAGVLLGESPFVVNADSGSQGEPELAWDGSQYLVVWQLYETGGYNVYGARVGATGTLLDPSAIAISTATDDQRYPVVASTGSGFLVSWDDERNGVDSDIYAARVSAAGALLDANGIAVLAESERQSRVAIAASGTSYLLVWEDRRPGPNCVYGARVDDSGRVLDRGGVGIASGPG